MIDMGFKTNIVLVTKNLAEAAFKCLDCQKVFVSSRHLKKHAVRRHHQHLSNIDCPGKCDIRDEGLKDAAAKLETMLNSLQDKIDSKVSTHFLCDRGVSTESPSKLEKHVQVFPVKTNDVRKSVSLFTLPSQGAQTIELAMLLQNPGGTEGEVEHKGNKKSLDDHPELKLPVLEGVGDGSNKIDGVEPKEMLNGESSYLEPLLVNLINKLDNLCASVKPVAGSFSQVLEEAKHKKQQTGDDNSKAEAGFAAENLSSSSRSKDDSRKADELSTLIEEESSSECEIDSPVQKCDKKTESLSNEDEMDEECEGRGSSKPRGRTTPSEAQVRPISPVEGIEEDEIDLQEKINHRVASVNVPLCARDSFVTTREHLIGLLDEYVKDFILGKYNKRKNAVKAQLNATLDSLCIATKEPQPVEHESSEQIGFQSYDEEDDSNDNYAEFPLKPAPTVCVQKRNVLPHSPGLIFDSRIVCKDGEDSDDSSKNSYNKFMTNFVPNDRIINHGKVSSIPIESTVEVEEKEGVSRLATIGTSLASKHQVTTMNLIQEKVSTKLNQEEYTVLLRHETSELQRLIDNLLMDLHKWKKAKRKKLSATLRVKLEQRLSSNLSLLGIDNNCQRLSDAYATSIKILLDDRRSKSSKGGSPTYLRALKAAFVQEVDRIARSRCDYPY